MHRTGPLSTREQLRLRYSDVCRRLHQRYQRPDGRVVTTVGGEATRYYTLESMAAVKYLGCDPQKLGVPGLEDLRIRPV